MKEQEKYEDESFRDSISTVDDKGKRVWVYPKKPSGKLTKYRNIVSIVLLAFLFGGPFIRIGGEPLLLMNIIERKFVIFGQVFWPQDFVIFGLGMITMVVFIILFTVVYGRLFCGWVCPQTIFMENVFRKIEYWIEGDYTHQKKLNKGPWTREKILKKTSKHILFYLISFIIANTFLAYVIGSDELINIITDPPSAHVAGLVSIIIFSLIFYFIFSRFREQVCTVVCPYGRLQGVLLDKKSIVVAYDYIRGEKRAKFKKSEDRKGVSKGDCIDCNQCVAVCPTGIDIRNGTQMECTNCTACIDACNFMMEKVGLEKGLIRYDSEEGIAKKEPFKFNTRIKAYSAVLLLLCTILVVMLTTRDDVETTILRTPGMVYQDQGDGNFSNLYNFKMINKTNNDFSITLQLESDSGEIKMVGAPQPQLEKHGVVEGTMFVVMHQRNIKQLKMPIVIGVYSEGQLIETVETSFLGPMQ